MTRLMMHWHLVQVADEKDTSTWRGNRLTPAQWVAIHVPSVSQV